MNLRSLVHLATGSLMIVAFSTNAQAKRYRKNHTQDPFNVCQMVPPNTQAFSIDTSVPSTVTQEVFNEVMNTVEAKYRPLIAQAGGKLVIDRLWDNDEANAYADRPGKSVWAIHMFGGLARHPYMTPDAMMMVACHEIGHHMGGAPAYTEGWHASAEGEADYYATLKCMKLVLNDPRINNIGAVQALGSEVTPDVVSACGSYQGNQNAEAICIRSIVAGLHLAATLTDLENAEASTSPPAKTLVRTFLDMFAITHGYAEVPYPLLTTPDLDQVPTTLFNSYPPLQCRLDTYVAGARCPVDPNQTMSEKDPSVGACVAGFRFSVAAPTAMSGGSRPLCWFNPTTPTGRSEAFPQPLTLNH